MRRITAWVAIVAVPPAVTGFFGQNVPYPGFGTAGGFMTSALIIILASVLFIIFKRRMAVRASMIMITGSSRRRRTAP
jgi:magnesium transporter